MGLKMNVKVKTREIRASGVRNKRSAAEREVQLARSEKGQASERSHRVGLSRLWLMSTKNPFPPGPLQQSTVVLSHALCLTAAEEAGRDPVKSHHLFQEDGHSRQPTRTYM